MREKSKHDEESSPIVAAARAIERAMARFDALVTEVERASLTTRKGIDRAARATQDAARVGDEMGQLVAALGEAIGALSKQQDERSQSLLGRSREIKDRHDELSALTDRFESLANETGALNAEVQLFSKMDLATDAEKTKRLLDIAAKMAPIIERARELSENANAANFSEIVKQADALAQSLVSAKNKMELATKKLSS